eukprot:CAMPEP_0177763246 /NCGR_PEP_ID=MMETSP0491_2-20121128/6771_1 /TAXON_ID=63592 /ORGANISM="Tetraselmis chuii, Strain PLY429" /LENGTH=275 /DNA_ID=CAMNT_0019279345 /DNA_START=183 /DNA_END=1010 /DNA_ORIENTATION=+
MSRAEQPRVMLVSDLDYTMVDHSDTQHAALRAFAAVWKSHFERDSLLVFNTGRSLQLFNQLQADTPHLLRPNVLICSVGTEIYWSNDEQSEWSPDAEWSEYLDQGWDRAALLDVGQQVPGLVLQRESEQRPHKISYHVETNKGARVVAQLEEAIRGRGLRAQVISSSGVDVDVLAEMADKGGAVGFLLTRMKNQGTTPTAGVLVNGDSGNDVGMFKVPEAKGCCVGNAHEELRQFCTQANDSRFFLAKRRCAGGIIDALQHFGWLPADADVPALP